MVSQFQLQLYLSLSLSYRYNEAIVLFKGPPDTAWHASALEGLATIPVVEAWASTHGVVRQFCPIAFVPVLTGV